MLRYIKFALIRLVHNFIQSIYELVIEGRRLLNRQGASLSLKPATDEVLTLGFNSALKLDYQAQ